MKNRCTTLVIGLAFACTSLTWAGQAVNGTISGKVVSPTGAPIPNAVITVTNVNTQAAQKELTGPDGSFSISSLAPGTYTLVAEAAGYKQTVQQNVPLSATAATTVHISMVPGKADETVAITATAPVVQAENGETSLTISTENVRELPVIDRNHQQLTQLSPGVTPPGRAMPLVEFPQGDRTWNTNGQPSWTNLQRLDGLFNQEFYRNTAVRVVPDESIRQMQLTTGSYTASKGFASGSILNVPTSDGANAWHGSLFEFHSDNNLQARNFFNTANNPIPKFVYNQFGATVGGSVIPDKVFFFGSYQGTYNRGANTQVATVPTAEMRAGNFSGVPGLTLFNPRTGTVGGTLRTPFFNGQIPAGQISPVAAAINSFLPPPNQPGFVNNLVANVPYQNDGNVADLRVDTHISDSTSGFLRYGYSNYRTVQSSILGDVVGAGERSRLEAQTAAADLTHSFSPNLLTELRLGYNRYQNRLRDTALQGPLAASFGLSGSPNNFLPAIQIAGMPALGSPAVTPANEVDNTYNLANQWNWHTRWNEFKGGIDVLQARVDGFQNQLFGPRGGALFEPGATMLAGGPALGPYSSFANSFASFLLGAPGAVGVTNFTETPTIRQMIYGAYLSDNITMKNLTVDLGVRWEIYSPLWSRRAGGAQIYNPATNTLSFVGTGSLDNPYGNYDLDTFAPRVGLAYRVTPKTVMRGGYGLNYFQPPYALSGFMPAQFGTVQGVPGTFTVAPSAFGAAQFPALQPAPAAPALSNGMPAPNVPLSAFPATLETPYVQSFNLQVQQEFVDGIMLSAGYVGALGRHLPFVQELNLGLPGTGVAGLPFASAGRTASTLFYDRGLTSNYNALQVSLTKRFAHGLSFQGSYTWSKTLGYTSENGMLLNPFDLRSNYGPADYDRQHMLTISHLWQLPFGPGTGHLEHGIVAQLVGNWQINGVFTWATGTPFTVTADPLTCLCPNSTVLASVTGPVSFTNGIGMGQTFFNTSAFSTPPAGQFGNAGRNTFRGPGFKNYDLSLFRDFNVVEHWKLELRGEAYNLTNTPRFMNPVANLNAADFGQVTGTANGALGRQLNLGVRLLF